MGSLNAVGGPTIVSKDNKTFRNRGGKQIYKTDSDGDVKTTIVSAPPAREEGEWNIVRDDNSLHSQNEIVTGTYMGGRSSALRIASENGAVRSLDVNLAGNKTIAVVPTALEGTTPQIGLKHTGTKVVENNSVSDTVERKSDEGAFGPH